VVVQVLFLQAVGLTLVDTAHLDLLMSIQQSQELTGKFKETNSFLEPDKHLTTTQLTFSKDLMTESIWASLVLMKSTITLSFILM
jgi:hypothetical protein